MNGKKGNFNNLVPMAIGLVVFIVVVGLGASILDGISDTQTAGELPANITQTGLEGIEDLADWTPTIVVIAVAAIIIGMILVFQGREQR